MWTNTSTLAIPPGETIRELLEERGMSQKEFAARMGFSEKHVSNLINGKTELTHDTAQKLALVFDCPARFWNNLELQYREDLATVKMELQQQEDEDFSRNFPYGEAAKYGWLPSATKVAERVKNLCSFFEVASLSVLKNPTARIPGIAYRCLNQDDGYDYSLALWSQRAKIEARSIKTEKINFYLLQELIPQMRCLTTQSPDMFCEELVQLCASCGVALVFLPHLKGSYLHGASFFDGEKIVVAITVRGKDADRFWFSFFHEMGHVLFLHIRQDGDMTKEQEDSANAFARDTLISKDQFTRLHTIPFSKNSILAFAKKIGVAPGIVVGRLQHEKLVNYSDTSLNSLKEKYELSAT
jgi:HTH-type transcriptional regulator/antitoxin HigA